MSLSYRQVASCCPPAASDVYIFTILPTADRGIVAITSNNHLYLLDSTTLQTSHAVTPKNLPKNLTSLVVADDGCSAICGGVDGLVSIFDVRTRAQIGQFQTGKPINVLACRGNDLAVGSETVVSVWDRRQSKPRWQNTENNDEITALDFHPLRNNILLSGGDDGLVSIFDTLITEEDDSLLQAVNHGPIHKAGFLGPDELYALSSDQNLALHSLTLDDSDLDKPASDQLGDLRPKVPCEYVIDVFPSGPDYVTACGSHSHSQVDLVKVRRGIGLDLTRRVVLHGAHGGEIVRSIYVDEQTGVVFTAGEDGQVAAFRASEGDASSSTPSKTSKSKKHTEGRYRPY
ncbi:hypothetical protein PV10_00696 [Exophiala mesophila]|uniref:Uncharacterized protein n=1 Tax=Exophiala mesophila TaxID=212818 RepID=A0A0D1ZQJ5_EXOME|nr:uncharacterized protein PV10_00696 [Exophiala mesophila]KIV96882.1 hypothetical protein PV10_00696 [Exophiala mesophila]